MKIRRIPLSKDMLLRMPSDERAFLLLAGHIQNELNSLNKVFSWCLANPSPANTSAIEHLANGMQAMIYARILIGKLWEAWEVLAKAFFSSTLAQRIEARLQPDARSALTKIKSYFGRSNTIYRVRNSFAFHYSVEEFNKHWLEAADEPNFDLIAGGTVGNNLCAAGELVVNTALLNGINSDSKADALTGFFDDVHAIATSFTQFLEGTIVAILEEHVGSGLATLGREEEIFPSQRCSEVTIPFFYKIDAVE